jgi:hypothetical protein
MIRSIEHVKSLVSAKYRGGLAGGGLRGFRVEASGTQGAGGSGYRSSEGQKIFSGEKTIHNPPGNPMLRLE